MVGMRPIISYPAANSYQLTFRVVKAPPSIYKDIVIVSIEMVA